MARSQKDSPRFSRAAGATVRQGRHEKLLSISCALAIAFLCGIVGYSPATLAMRIPSDEIIMTTVTTHPMTQATTRLTSLAARMIVPSAEYNLRYAEQLVSTIPSDMFAKMPMKDLSSPAFYIGHLSIYCDRICTLLGRADLVTPMPYAPDVYKGGAVCLEQSGLYADKDLLVNTFLERQRRAIEAFACADDKAFAAEHPAEGRFKEMFPTVGSVTAFLLTDHTSIHLGQISAWRRVIGLGPVG